MGKYADLTEGIREINKCLLEVKKRKKSWEDNEGLLEMLGLAYNVYYSQIHDYLTSQGTNKAEEEIRRLCRELKSLYLPIFETKIKDNKKDLAIAGRYLMLMEKYEALVAYRDLMQFALYMEKDLPADKQILTMAHRNELIQPIFYTSQQMVLEGTVKKLFKNTPTGYFKCVKADTEVRTPNGNVQIKDLNIGDEVYSMQDNKLCVERVTDKAFTYKPQVKITTATKNAIVVSPEHRLLTQRGYIEAQDISLQDDCLFVYKNGEFAKTKIAYIEFDEQCVDMVDICVSNTHNFIANGIVSHNSYSDVIIISWILGYNTVGDCLKVVGNPKMVTKVVNGVSNTMLSKRYADVFPFYKRYECDAGKMFKILAPRAGEMLLAHATGIDFSLLCISKETPIDGGRYKYRFYDDITNSKYKTNITMHDADDAAYNDQWKKRRYTEFDDCEWFTGTVYFYLDFLSRRRNENGFEQAVPLKNFRYTRFCKEKKSVFVVIPKLDYETDECTFPQIYSTEQAKIDRSNDFDTFQAMEQGMPVIPEGMPFDYSNMKTWSELPLKESEGGMRSDVCMAALDLPRTGDNNLSLIVFSKCGEFYYIVDAIYQKKPLDTRLPDGRSMLDLVCEKLKQRCVKHLVAETNVCSNIKDQIEEKLQKMNFACSIEEVYSTMKKEDKIFDSQADIQQHIVIPANGIFGLSSDVGKAVFEIVTWNVKAKSDDSIDTVSMFVRQFINNKKQGFATAHTFKR